MEEYTNKQKHYVCLGECGGVSENPGVCQSTHCSKHDHELVGCTCHDGLHDTEIEKNTNI